MVEIFHKTLHNFSACFCATCIGFPLAAFNKSSQTVALNNTNLLSYNSVDQKFDMGLTD